MAIELQTLDQLSAAEVAAQQAELAQRLLEDNPALDLKRGVLHDLLLHYAAAMRAWEQWELDRYLSARSLKQIGEDPTLAEEGVVDDVLSNYRLSRQDGAAAGGEVVVVLSGPHSVTVASGAVFSASGHTFTADRAYTAKAEAEQINNASDRLLTQLADGNWAFTIQVTAEDTGAAALLKKDTLLVPAARPTGYVTSYAAADFTGGVDAETNTELVARLQQGLAARAPSNRVNLQAMLREVAAYSRVVTSSIIGYGDAEMLRDQHSILPVSLGGRCDWYIRTVERAVLQTLSLTATLLSVNASGHGTWQVSLGRDTAPGFYEVVSVRPVGAGTVLGTLSLVSDTRGLDLSGTGFIPDIATVAEGAYSRYQTAVVRFQDTSENQSAMAVGATRAYEVTVRGLPLLADIQDYLNGFSVRSYGADFLVKAPVPCFLQLSFSIFKASSQADPDLAAIRDAMAREVNTVGFVGRLAASQLHDVIHGYLSEGMSVGAIDMFGRLRRPDATILYLRDNDLLSVEEEDGTMVSPRTVQFFLDPDDVAVSVLTEVPEPV